MYLQDCRTLTEQPIFFERNRVYRITQGGLLFHRFFGDEAKDTNYPEEWVASSVPATLNKGRDPREGISVIKGTHIGFDELLRAEPARMLGDRKELGVLLKVLDGSMRLPVQVHPSKSFSQKYLGSQYGKAEAWLILATRGDAAIRFGFSEKIDKKTFMQAIERDETQSGTLDDLMLKIPVMPGDIFFIPAGAVHAIGADIMLLEIQEPTDFTITPETWCGGHQIDNRLKYLGLSQDIALQCFDYNIYGKEAERLCRRFPRRIENNEHYTSEKLIDCEDTPCFAMNRHRVRGTFPLKNAPAIWIVAEGTGTLSNDSQKWALHRGNYFFLPYALAGQCVLKGNGELELIECLPPR